MTYTKEEIDKAAEIIDFVKRSDNSLCETYDTNVGRVDKDDNCSCIYNSICKILDG